MGEVGRYEIFPVGFWMLPAEKRLSIAESFRRLCVQAQRELRFYAIRSSRSIPLPGAEYTSTYYRFYVECDEPIDYLLSDTGFSFQSIPEIPELKVKREKPKFLVLEDGRRARAYTIWWLPSTLNLGFLGEIYRLEDVERVVLTVKPLMPDEAVGRMRRYTSFLRSIALADRSKGRLPREELQLKLGMAEEIYRMLARGRTHLFEVKCNLLVDGGSLAEVREKSERVKRALRVRLVRIDSPAFLQKAMVLGLAGKKLTVDWGGLGAFFPFIGRDIVETPGGIFLGEAYGEATPRPVIFDPFLRTNYNILIVGKSGAGKSFTSKIFLTRLAAQHRNMAYFVIDPEQEYVFLAEIGDARRVRIFRGQPLGLDPVRIFEEKDVGARIIADMVYLPYEPPELWNELRSLMKDAESIYDIYEAASPGLKAYLKDLVEGMDSFLIQGEPPTFSKRMVFDLSSLHSEFVSTKDWRRNITLQRASILLFSKIWQMIEDESFLPRHVPKAIVIDEVWLYTQVPAAAAFMETVARRGRKRNLLFIINTQMARDVLEGPGRALVENCATKILLSQEASAAKYVGEAFNLPKYEVEVLPDLAPGRAFMIADAIHIPIAFYASDEEYWYFTTKPEERAKMHWGETT